MESKTNGFTLVELLTALIVLAILFGIAIPSFRNFILNNRTTTTQNDLVTAFTYARSEALRRGTPVSVCASKDASTCSGDVDWATGWIVFVDSGAATGTREPADANEVVLQAWASTSADMSVSGNTTSYIQYGPTGVISSPGAATFQVYPQGCTGEHMRQIAVSAVGSLSSTSQSCPSP
jgi:type IV fimbrial biogenesis protein FimT